MSITAKLAYKQLKINRQRTILTLISIILSTALITTVYTFAASVHRLFVGFLGGADGEFDRMITELLLVPVGLLSVIIILMSVIVISNVFRVSANERIKQFGILKSVGAVKGQIVSTVSYEGILLSLVGIPLGIILGLFLSFIGVNFANLHLEEVNRLVRIMTAHLMIEDLTLALEFVVVWQVLVICVLISFFTILFSAWIPAKKSTKMVAIDSIRNSNEIQIKKKQMRTSAISERIFGFEGVLSIKNVDMPNVSLCTFPLQKVLV